MKNLAILFFLLIFALTSFGQTPQKTAKKLPKPAKTVVPKLGTETEEFEKAKAIEDAGERITAFQKFIKNFPESTELPRAQGIIFGARAAIADKKLEAGETQTGIELFKLLVQEAPTPVPDELFTKVILGFPLSLYSRNQRGAAFDMVKLIEEKVGANAAQLLDLSKFYINVQYGTEAIRLAKKSTELAPDSATGFLTLAIANRLNFQLEDAAHAYAKAAELDPESVTNKRSLAEMKRALGKPDEAAVIYRQLLEKDGADTAAQSGLILALFSSDKIKEAEVELAKTLEANPNNLSLLNGVAYWYAAHNKGDKAVEYAQKALAIDRTSVWSYVAQARGLLAQNKPLEAEKVLLLARQFGDFPTLDYELASARMAAGLYREAAETLKRNFTVNKDGAIETYLGNRILADAETFTELLSLERRVALFETKAADSEENTNKLKSLLVFSQKLEAKETTEDELAAAADEFGGGGDNMRPHRQIFAANRLLQKKTALPKVLDLMQSAIGAVDGALNVASPSSAVLADEIYDSRQYAMTQNLVVVVPELPRPTLSAILRGQIEDIAGRALLQQNNVPQSIIRLKRAMSVLPDKSAWSRASAWHLGEALQAEGKEKEALEAYIRGYNKDIPNPEQRAFIENLYVKVNGNTDGLDERVGAKPETTVATSETKPTPTNTDNVKTTEPTPEAKPEASPTVNEVKTEPTPSPKTVETQETKPETKPETKTEPTTLPENVPAATPEKIPEASPTPTETPKTEEAKPTETKPEEVKQQETKPEETKPVEVKPEPSPTPTETPTTVTQPTPTPETKTEEIKQEETKPVETKPALNPAATPTPQNVSVIITDNLSQTPSKTKTEESKPEPKPAEKIPPNISKPLFEPVIINVGKSDTPTPEKTETKPSEEKPTEVKQMEEKPSEAAIAQLKLRETEPAEKDSTDEKPVEDTQKTEPEFVPTRRIEKKSTDEKPTETIKKPEVIITDNLKPENKPAEKQPDEKILSGENRPRIIITENTGSKSVTEEISGCKLVINPDSLSLLNGGGSLGVTVAFEGEGDFRQITAVSSSSEDVEVRLDPEIGASQNRAFFIVKSISTKTGVYTITFEAPCGKKEILVKVR